MRIVIVGAGLSGLTAARALASEHDVTVLDKGRSVGGRLATRRIGEAVLDHGAQFFTVRGDAFRRQVDDWVDRGLAHVWCHGFSAEGDGYPRYVGSAGMNPLAKDLAAGLDCRPSQLVFTLRRREEGWDVVIDDGSVVAADAVLLTAPIAQSWALLAQSELDVPDELFRCEYHRTIGLLTVLDRPSAVPQPGGVQLDPADAAAAFGFVGDNQAKGISPVPAVTFHATQPWSLEHWDDDTEQLRSALLDRAAPFLGGAEVLDAQVKKWRFAGPLEPWPEPCWVDDEHRVVLAGDLFAGPKVEGAFNSGLAAAAAVASLA
ncbi:MAG: NAD(P)/FAD-dependent oxidoreductase [Acidimicrobiia bacterium]